MRYPNLVIIGAPKAGTTTLYEVLGRHSDVFVPGIKEPMFFNREENYKMGLEYYAKKYYGNVHSEKIIADCTPLYIGSEITARRIRRDLCDNVKIVAILREPVERAYSHYLHFKRIGHEKDPFELAIKKIKNNKQEYSDYVWYSMYSRMLQIWFKNFDKKNILILKFENDIKANLSEGMKKICHFLEIDEMTIFEEITRNNARIGIKGTQWLRNLILRDSKTKDSIKRFVPPHIRQTIRHDFDNLTMSEISKKESMTKEFDRDLYWEFFHDDMLSLKNMTGIDFTREN